jgi:hypothetical protein
MGPFIALSTHFSWIGSAGPQISIYDGSLGTFVPGFINKEFPRQRKIDTLGISARKSAKKLTRRLVCL